MCFPFVCGTGGEKSEDLNCKHSLQYRTRNPNVDSMMLRSVFSLFVVVFGGWCG